MAHNLLCSWGMREEERKLRHPKERRLFVVFAILNLLLMVTAISLALKGADWLEAHPLLNRYRGSIRALAIAAITLPATVVFLRNTRHALMRGKSITISPQQLPEIYAILQHHCEKLGMDYVPGLYFTDSGLKKAAHAYRSWKCDYIVLSSQFFQPDLQPMRPVFAFWIGRELGRLRLHHSSWPTEFLIAYVDKIPHLSNSLRRVFCYSEDRYGAYLAPEGLPALVGLASGRLMLPRIDISEYMNEVQRYGGVWASLGLMTEPEPTTRQRIRALIDAGLWKPEFPQAQLQEPEAPRVKTAAP